MIFVILGILILVVSFVVALISVRREKGLFYETGPKNESSEPSEPVEYETMPSTDLVSDDLSKGQKVFPWEQEVGEVAAQATLRQQSKTLENQTERLQGQFSLKEITKQDESG